MKFIMTLFLLFASHQAFALCEGRVLNPLSDVSWDCMFPMGAVGMSVGDNEDNMSSDEDTNQTAICECLSEGVLKVGIPFSFWEPSTIIEVVSDPWCMHSMGVDMSSTADYALKGAKHNATHRISKQVHYVTFPALKILDMYYDIPCIKNSEEYDYAMLTELLPYWQNDALAAVYYPESVLFANQASQLACSADAAALLTGMGATTDTLYWCLGSTGTVYPLAGTIRSNDEFQATAALAARTIFMMGRMGALMEYHPSGCYSERKYIWNKSRYKYHAAIPSRVSYCTPIGSDAFLQPPGVGFPDNKSLIIFRKVDCCTWGD